MRLRTDIAVLVFLTVSHVVCLGQNVDFFTADSYYPYEKTDIEKSGGKAKISALAQSSAKRALNEKVRISISAESRSSSTWTKSQGQYIKSETFNETFTDDVVSTTGLVEWIGLTFTEKFDEKKRICYVTVKADQTLTVAHYNDEWKKLNQAIAIYVGRTKEYARNKSFDLADQAIASAYEGVVLREEIERILKVIAGRLPEENDRISYKDLDALKTYGKLPASIEELSYMVAKDFSQLTKARKLVSVSVNPMVFRETESATDFSVLLTESIENQLQKQGNLSVERSPLSNARLTGYYYVTDSVGTIFINVEMQVNKERFPRLYRLPSTIFKSQLEYLPRQRVVMAQHIRTLENGKVPNTIGIYLRTGKGRTHNLYKAGENIDFIVRADRPCFIKAINFSDYDSPQLITDNFEITADQVNKEIKLFEGTVFAPPYGTERTVIMARSEPWPSTPSFSVDKKYNVVAGNILSFIEKARTDAASGVFQYGEDFVSNTTVKN